MPPLYILHCVYGMSNTEHYLDKRKKYLLLDSFTIPLWVLEKPGTTWKGSMCMWWVCVHCCFLLCVSKKQAKHSRNRETAQLPVIPLYTKSRRKTKLLNIKDFWVFYRAVFCVVCWQNRLLLDEMFAFDMAARNSHSQSSSIFYSEHTEKYGQDFKIWLNKRHVEEACSTSTLPDSWLHHA